MLRAVMNGYNGLGVARMSRRITVAFCGYETGFHGFSPADCTDGVFFSGVDLISNARLGLH
jgi:hypothetical protein